jgi:hypothetical protein
MGRSRDLSRLIGDNALSLPTVTTAQRSATPKIGDKHWNSTLGGEEVYTDAGWVGGKVAGAFASTGDVTAYSA